MERRDTLHYVLDSGAIARAANFASTAVDLHLERFTELIVSWKINSAERDTGDETYDLYIITGDGVSEWDIVHFPQVATTGAKTFTARVACDGIIPQTITTAAPGVAANDSATLATGAGQANAPKSLAAGSVRHGALGGLIRYELVVAGTIAVGISFVLQIEARR